MLDTPDEAKDERGFTQRTLASLKNLASTLSRANFLQRLGMSHDGARNLYEVFGYKRALAYDDYLDKYLRQDIAARAVDAFPSATWATPPQMTGTKKFNKAWNNLNNEFQIWQLFNRLDRLLGLGEYAVLYMGFNDNRPLDQAPSKRNGLKIIYLQPFGQKSITVKEWEEDRKNPRYGLPTIYTINQEPAESSMGSQTKVFNPGAQDVHWQRCIHVVEDPLENEVFGVARLQRVYNVLDDLLKVCGGTAETFWITANRGIQADVDKDMSFSKADADSLSEEIDEYIHGLRRVMRTRGVKVTNIGSDVPDPRGTFDVLVTMLAGALGIPKRILLGSEAGQLASEQDRTNWANRIEERRTNFAEPRVLWPFFNRLIDLGILPAGPTKIAWPSAFRMSPFEKSQTAAQKARSAANLAKLFVGPPKAIDPNAQAANEAKAQAQADAQANKPQGNGQQPPVPAKGTQPVPAPTLNAKKPVIPEDQIPKTPGGGKNAPAEYEPLLTRDEARAIILTDEIQPEFADDPADIARSET